MREATSQFRPPLRTAAGFNPRLRAGGDLSGAPFTVVAAQFQSTPPCGRRRSIALRIRVGLLFQSTPPCGRRQSIVGEGRVPAWFQSTPPCGRRPGGRVQSLEDLGFQSTPPCGRRRRSPGKRERPREVSIHASVREATSAIDPTPSSPSFNPRLRAGGDLGTGGPCAPGEVSIHASVREATLAQILSGLVFGVSIHASVREATTRCCCRQTWCWSFNPRLRAGGDEEDAHRVPGQGVSIHASVREATRDDWIEAREGVVSIHASVREATVGFGIDASNAWFQSTPPCGRRPHNRYNHIHVVSFNPRLRAGGDRADGEPWMSHHQFQSTPPCGRRPPTRSSPRDRRCCFNPRLRAGGDRPARLCRARSRWFNPRLRAGGDSTGGCRPRPPCSFNPRLRAGGDPAEAHGTDWV